MSLEELKALKEPYLDSKGYEKGKSIRSNCSSFIKTLLDFMQEHGYEELTDDVISEYLKSYEGTSNIGVRTLRVKEFAEYAKEKKGEREMSLFEGLEGEPEQPVEQPVPEMLKKRGRKAKAENENRTQISAYLSNEVYAGIKALSAMTQQPISDIVAQVVNVFYEDNIEVINESIRAMQQLESVKSRIRYHR